MSERKRPNRLLFRAEPGRENTVLNWHNQPDREFGFFAESFHKAAKILVENLELDRGGLSDFDACPVVFLYRHALELYIKAILLGEGANFLDERPSPQDIFNEKHRLTVLLGKVRRILEVVGWDKELGSDIIPTFDDVEKVVAELEQVDPDSHAFRYPVKRNLKESVESHFTFSVVEFAKRIDAVLEVFATAKFALPEQWSAEAEVRGYYYSEYAGDYYDPPDYG
jgi:hypothetical protein